jgi:predicted regulator of Ras-like GTPase activity (Roadblock/LC7/MglB family)
MASIRDVVEALGRRDGVEAAIILGNDGLPIASHVANGGDPDVLAALIPNVLTASDQLGQHAGRGTLTTGVLEYAAGTAVISHLTSEATLLLLVRARTNIGPLLYDLTRHRSEIAGLL